MRYLQKIIERNLFKLLPTHYLPPFDSTLRHNRHSWHNLFQGIFLHELEIFQIVPDCANCAAHLPSQQADVHPLIYKM